MSYLFANRAVKVELLTGSRLSYDVHAQLVTKFLRKTQRDYRKREEVTVKCIEHDLDITNSSL